MITREYGDARYRVTLTHGSVAEECVGAWARGLSELRSLEGLALDAGVISRIFFDGATPRGEVAELAAASGSPMMLIRGDYPAGKHTVGVQACTISGTPVRQVTQDGRVVGCAYADDDAEYCHLTGILPQDLRCSNVRQAESCFLRMEDALRQAGMDFSHVVRTWIYLASLLDWYAEFNTVRTAFFKKRGVFDGLVPASTGIGAANHAGAAIVTGLLAIRPKHKAVTIQAVPSPLQCPALNYRSSFSRAVELGFPDRRHLLISGTASIAADGTTLYQGDVDKQISRTMDVVNVILQSRGMRWEDLTRGIVYFRDGRDAPRFDAYCRKRHLPPLPLIVADHVIVCRDDLLFEIEVDAVQDRPASPTAK